MDVQLGLVSTGGPQFVFEQALITLKQGCEPFGVTLGNVADLVPIELQAPQPVSPKQGGTIPCNNYQAQLVGLWSEMRDTSAPVSTSMVTCFLSINTSHVMGVALEEVRPMENKCNSSEDSVSSLSR